MLTTRGSGCGSDMASEGTDHRETGGRGSTIGNPVPRFAACVCYSSGSAFSLRATPVRIAALTTSFATDSATFGLNTPGMM